MSAGDTPRHHATSFERLLEAVPDAIVGVDQAGVIRFVNHQVEALFGYDRDAMVGQLVEMLLPESFRAAHQAQRAGYLEHPTARMIGSDLLLTGRKSDGTEFPVDISLSHSGTGEGLSVIAAMRDMTSRHQAEESRRRADRLAAVVEFSGEAIISVAPDGIITSWNPAAERLYGYGAEEVMGRSIKLLTPEGLTDEIRAKQARIRAGETVDEFVTTLVRKDGTVASVLLTISPIHDQDGSVIGASAIARDVTGPKQAFEAAQRMAAIVEFSGEAIITSTPEGLITSWNLAAERMFGYGCEEILGRAVGLLSPESAAEECSDILAGMRAGRPAANLDTIRIRKDGTAFPALLTVSAICDEEGAVVGVCAIIRDMTEQKQSAQNARSLSAAQDLVSNMMGSAWIGIALADLDGSFRVVNQSLCTLLGYDEAFFLTKQLPDFVHPDDAEEAIRARASVIAGTTDNRATQLRLVRADGATVWVRRLTVLIPGADGDPNLLMVQVEDITAEHEAQEALAFHAIHDPLTGLHNRAWILDTLEADLRTAKRQGTSVGALLVDLDHFNVVNDSLGHTAGDEVMTTVADRIVTALRPGDHLGRFGGDSFVIVVQDVHDVQDVEQCAERVSASIAADLQVQGHRIVPTASIGIAVSTPTCTPESLLRDTDSALSRAKAAGRGRWQFFDGAMHAQAVARLIVEDQLRDAITRGEFVVHYQPIVALADSQVVGHEALVRWMHPTRGLLGPGDFLEVAEDTGLITAIGAQVLDQVCALLAARPDLPSGISVNVSAVQLAAPDWLSGVMESLARHAVDPDRIVIEVTETAALSLTDSALSALTHLSRLGVGIHLDDFGTGYSSISVLRDLPVTGVKLDLRFVHDLTTGHSQANALAHGLSGLVNGMHLTGIAEGIETPMQASILRAQGWRLGQGYYFGRPAPMPAEDLDTDNDLIA